MSARNLVSVNTENPEGPAMKRPRAVAIYIDGGGKDPTRALAPMPTQAVGTLLLQKAALKTS